MQDSPTAQDNESTQALRPWPASKVKLVPLSKIIPYENNVLIHTPEQVAQIADSMQRFGVTAPLLIDEDGVLIYGHGRLLAAQKLGFDKLPVCVAVGWPEVDKRAYRVADNQLGRISLWDMPALKVETDALRMQGFDMPLLGFGDDLKLVSFIANNGAPEGAEADVEEEPAEVERGAMLRLIDVTIADPKHIVVTGDHWLLDKRHHLLCTGVIRDWSRWAPLLQGDALFCPYPGVFVPFGSRSKTNTLVMVQPDAYIAGHILDRYAEVHGAESVEKCPPPKE